ncbi:hypothetical protein [Amycolatopsis sp. cmx-4-61]|uniref:hypothetical protein n=1 Tax=Amycolatopsis sp. cmx-4-61 TaxID=2790937 RepID=UPI0039781FDC
MLRPQHHKVVDDNPAAFPIELLEWWKWVQIGQADDLVAVLRQQVSALTEPVAALSHPGQRWSLRSSCSSGVGAYARRR